MTQDELKAKMEEAVKDEAFMNQLAEAENAEEAQKLFESKGISLSLEEVKALASQLKSASGELSDDALENVSGGLATPVLVIIGGTVLLKIASKIKW